MAFADDVFGTPFGEHTLATTISWSFTRDGINEASEADVLFNRGRPWNCYRGARWQGATDLQRVALHEFGHVLGLSHPDDATPVQTVDAIMNSWISNIDKLQLDDIQGALTLYGVPVVGIPFPPRDQVLDFFLPLETAYRDTLGRSQTNAGYVDAEGSAVWFTEWLRYVLNDCSATEATDRVVLQIRGLGIQPVCGVVAEGTINFPPRDQALDFLNTLDAFYRDDLQRRVELSHVDLEGKAVWLQEYLRYRVNGLSDADARSQVLTQIQEAAVPIPEADIVKWPDASGKYWAWWTNGTYEGYAKNIGEGCASDVTWELTTWERMSHDLPRLWHCEHFDKAERRAEPPNGPACVLITKKRKDRLHRRARRCERFSGCRRRSYRWRAGDSIVGVRWMTAG